MRKKLAFLLTTILIFAAFLSSASAADNSSSSQLITVSEPEAATASFVYINNVNSTLSISGGTASIYNTISCSSGVDKIVISCYLQKYDGGWKTVSHWTKTSYSNSTSSSYLRTVSSGYTYRVISYFYAYDGTNVESTSRTDSQYY